MNLDDRYVTVPSSGKASERMPQLSQVVEALLFASQKTLTIKELLAHFKAAAAMLPESAAGAFGKLKEKDILLALQLLQNELVTTKRAYELRETASGWQFVTASLFAPWLRQLFPETRPARLSAPALETLAIIAYRQPIIRADIEAVRGVAVDGVMQTLLDRGLIRIAGRADVPGRPLLYTTTQSFLDHFGMKYLDELPNAAELRYIPLPQAGSEEVDKQPELSFNNKEEEKARLEKGILIRKKEHSEDKD